MFPVVESRVNGEFLTIKRLAVYPNVRAKKWKDDDMIDFLYTVGLQRVTFTDVQRTEGLGKEPEQSVIEDGGDEEQEVTKETQEEDEGFEDTLTESVYPYAENDEVEEVKKLVTPETLCNDYRECKG